MPSGFGTGIVNYADDFCVSGAAPAAGMLTAVADIMDRLKLRTEDQMPPMSRGTDEVSRHSQRMELSSGALAPYQRGYGPQVRRRGCGGESRGTQPDEVGRGELFHAGAGQSCLPLHRLPRCAAATTVALSQAQGEVRQVGAFFGCQAPQDVWPCSPCVHDQEPSVGEGMIPTESRVRETRTPGLTRRGVETRARAGNRGTGTWRKPPANCYSLRPTARRATPLLYAASWRSAPDTGRPPSILNVPWSAPLAGEPKPWKPHARVSTAA